MDITLTPEETAQILKQREARAPKVDPQRAQLLDDLAELNDRNRAGHHGPLPRDLDVETVAMIRKIQDVGIRMTAMPHGYAAPVHIPSRVAYEIVKAIRGDRAAPKAPGGFAVPSG